MRFRLLGASVVCALSFGIFAGCSHSAPKQDGDGDPPKTGATKQAIQGGSDDGATHPYAVGVCIGGNKGQCNGGLCSGALITPNLVVTARHCVQEAPEGPIACDANPPVRFGPSLGTQWITTNSKMFQTTLGWHQVVKITVPNDDILCGNDIALLTLDSPIPAAEATPVIPGVQYPIGDLDFYTHSYTAIGYGKISPADPPGNCFSGSGSSALCPGYRRIRSAIPILCIPGDEYIDCPIDPKLNLNEFVAGDGTCQGDSGSSAFETNTFKKGKPVTLGVLSRGGSENGNCVQGVYTRLDKYRDLVIQVAEQASNNWTLYPKPVPDWTIFVPPPADAGPPEAAAPKPRGDGVTCETNEQCASKVCADTGGGKACTIACVEGEPANCYEGMICKDSVCVVDPGTGTPGVAPSTTTVKESGCSQSPAGSGSGGWGAVGIAAALGLLLGARRRGPRRQTPEMP